MQARDAFVGRVLSVAREQAPDDVIVHAEAAKQGVAGGDLHHLRRGQRADERRGLFAHPEAEQRLLAVRADQALGQHQVREVGFTNLGEDLFCGHGLLRWLVLLGV